MKTRIRRLRDNLLGDISKKSGLKIPYFVFTIALIVTIAVTYFFYSSAKTIDAERFDNDIIKIRATIENRLDTYIAILRAGRGYFRSSEKVNREKFAEFVGNISLQRNYPGMQAIGFSKVFTAEEKESIEKQIKDEGFPNFTIKPETPRNEYQSIIFIEPFDEVNKKAHGFDMSSEPIRKAALDTARDTGVYAISGKITLIQEDEAQPQPGFLIYLAVYKGNTPNSVEERRKQLDGFIYSPFRMGSFIKDVVNEIKTETVSFRIYDNELSENNLLGIGVEEDKTTNSTLKAQNELDAGGRKWIITYQPSAKFNNQSLAWWTPIIFLLGLVTSVILFFLSLSQSRTNIRLLNIANELAQSEDEIHKLLESEQNARETAEKLNKVKDEFISVVSHELRTPLNAISGWVNVLKSQSLSEETKNRAISVINKNLRSQVSLVDNMIDFSDSSFLQNQSKWQKVVFSDIVDSCILEKDEAISNQKLRLTKEFTKEISVIYCDQAKVKKAILYLLDNAIKFTPEGGLIAINLTSDNYQLELKIKDSGEGIPPELLPNIFSIFNQSDSSTTRKKGGLGLGLALVKKIVEAHGGQIIAESEGLGKGSIFTIKFPLTEN